VAFDTLVRQYEHQVLRLALHLTGSEHDAEDIYQEAFLKAFRYIGNFRFECSFYTWIYRIVTNLCLDQLRRKKTRREIMRWWWTTPATRLTCWLQSQTTGRFQIPPRSWTARCWDRDSGGAVKLTPRERMVFELKHYQGLRLRTIGEIAAHHGRDGKEHAFQATKS